MVKYYCGCEFDGEFPYCKKHLEIVDITSGPEVPKGLVDKMYKLFKSEGLSEKQAFELLKTYIHGLAGGRLA